MCSPVWEKYKLSCQKDFLVFCFVFIWKRYVIGFCFILKGLESTVSGLTVLLKYSFAFFFQVVLCISVDVSKDYEQVENVLKQVRKYLIHLCILRSLSLCNVFLLEIVSYNDTALKERFSSERS